VTTFSPCYRSLDLADVSCLLDRAELNSSFRALTELTRLSIDINLPIRAYESILGLPKLKQLSIGFGNESFNGLLPLMSADLTGFELQGVGSEVTPLP